MSWQEDVTRRIDPRANLSVSEVSPDKQPRSFGYLWIVTVNACERVGRVSYTQDIVISVAVKVSCEKLVARVDCPVSKGSLPKLFPVVDVKPIQGCCVGRGVHDKHFLCLIPAEVSHQCRGYADKNECVARYPIVMVSPILLPMVVIDMREIMILKGVAVVEKRLGGVSFVRNPNQRHNSVVRGMDSVFSLLIRKC